MSRQYTVAINTAIDPFSYAIYDGSRVVYEHKQQATREFTEQFIYELQKGLQICGIGFENIAAIAVVKGPGSYTGLRVGISTAKTIAFVHKIPIYSLSSLELMALQQKNKELKIIVLTGRAQEITLQVFSENSDALSEPVSYDKESFINFCGQFKAEVALYGQCPDSFLSAIVGSNCRYISRSLCTEVLAQFAYQQLTMGLATEFETCVPYYVYQPVVGQQKVSQRRRK